MIDNSFGTFSKILEVSLKVLQKSQTQTKYFTNNSSKMKTISATPLPRPRMKKAKKYITLNYNLNLIIWEMNTHENRNTAYQELSIFLPSQN